MSAPRQVLPGTVLLVTRRCSERRYFLRPDKKTNAIFRYLLAVTAERFAIGVIAAVAMANHYHLIIVDRDGQVPAFLQLFNALLARAMNCHRGRWDCFWEGRQTHLCELADSDSVVETAAYVLANPVAAGAVERGSDWPGVRTSPSACTAKARVVPRPSRFFRNTGPLPATSELHICVPPSHEHLAPHDFAVLLAERVKALEKATAKKAAAEGRSFQGVRAIRKLPWSSRPHTHRPKSPFAPRVKAATRAIRRAILDRIATFLTRYNEALTAFRLGDHAADFPDGTWQLRRLCGVKCHPPPT